MEKMTNEEKAREIASLITSVYGVDIQQEIHTYSAAMEALKWKDEQFAEQKQEWIDKACQEHCNCCGYAYMACRRFNYDNLQCRYYVKFKKAMKGE